ncbi:variant-type mycofactocin precursor [Thermodesulfobacteriota bacterium]
MDEENKELAEKKGDEKEENIFSVTEITIEEMAIDGICGVY